MQIARIFFVISTAAVLLACSPDRANHDREEHIAQLLQEDGAVIRKKGVVLSVDCSRSKIESCNNYANTDMVYQTLMVPCLRDGIKGCTDVTHTMPIVGASSYWQLDPNDVIVYFGKTPPKPYSHYALQVAHYERSQESIPRPSDYMLPPAGENAPEPTLPTRRVVDNSIGDSLNQHQLRTSVTDLDSRQAEFIYIIAANKSLLPRIRRRMVEAGADANSINVKGLPDGLALNTTETGDSFRMVARIGRPFDEPAMKEYTAVKRQAVWRVSFPADVPFESFGPGEFKPRTTGKKELSGKQLNQYAKFQERVLEIHGATVQVFQAVGRSYDDHHCRETGSYCWGNNNDSLYVDINDPNSGELAVFDMEPNSSRVIVTGLDHQSLGFADFWNFGIFDDNGKYLTSVLFSDVQQQTRGVLGPVGAFWIQFRKHCDPSDEHCFEVPFPEDNPSRQISILNRIYVNPSTGTGPDASELVLPTVYYYRN